MESILVQKRENEFLLDNATLDNLPYEDSVIQKVIFKIKEQKIDSKEEINQNKVLIRVYEDKNKSLSEQILLVSQCT